MLRVVSTKSVTRPNALTPGTKVTATFCSIGANTSSPGFMLALKNHTPSGIVTVAGKVFNTSEEARAVAACTELPILEKSQRLDSLELTSKEIELDDGWFIPYQRAFTPASAPAIPSGITTHVLPRNPASPQPA